MKILKHFLISALFTAVISTGISGLIVRSLLIGILNLIQNLLNKVKMKLIIRIVLLTIILTKGVETSAQDYNMTWKSTGDTLYSGNTHMLKHGDGYVTLGPAFSPHQTSFLEIFDVNGNGIDMTSVHESSLPVSFIDSKDSSWTILYDDGRILKVGYDITLHKKPEAEIDISDIFVTDVATLRDGYILTGYTKDNGEPRLAIVHIDEKGEKVNWRNDAFFNLPYDFGEARPRFVPLLEGFLIYLYDPNIGKSHVWRFTKRGTLVWKYVTMMSGSITSVAWNFYVGAVMFSNGESLELLDYWSGRVFRSPWKVYGPNDQLLTVTALSSYEKIGYAGVGVSKTGENFIFTLAHPGNPTDWHALSTDDSYLEKNWSVHSIVCQGDSIMTLSGTQNGGKLIVAQFKKGTEARNYETSGIREEEEPVIKVYPNPAKDYVTFEIPYGSHLFIYDALGNELKHEISLEQKTIMKRNDLRSGIYAYSIRTDHGKVIKTGVFMFR